jgi:hypothetical protein
MSKFRRDLLISNSQGSEPLDSSLIFWAPMEQGDLTDHVTGIQMQLTGNGAIEWIDRLGIYMLTTPSSVNHAVLTFRNDNKLWKNYINNDYTVCAKICRFRNNYGVGNSTRVFACSPNPQETDRWFSKGMGVPANLFAVGGGINGNAMCGNNYETIYSFATTRHFTGEKSGNYDVSTYQNFKNGQMFSSGTDNVKSKFSEFSDIDNSGLNLGNCGHAVAAYCTFGIKDVRIYNRILTQQEIIEISQL